MPYPIRYAPIGFKMIKTHATPKNNYIWMVSAWNEQHQPPFLTHLDHSLTVTLRAHLVGSRVQKLKKKFLPRNTPKWFGLPQKHLIAPRLHVFSGTCPILCYIRTHNGQLASTRPSKRQVAKISQKWSFRGQ